MNGLLRLFAIVVLGFLAVFITMNLVDADAVQGLVVTQGIKPASLEADNGFYILWMLDAPPEKELGDQASVMEIRALFDPGFDNDRTIAAYLEKRSGGSRSAQAWKDLSPSFPADTEPASKDWFVFFRDSRLEVQRQEQQYAVLLERYADLLASPKVEDFTLPRIDAPAPNLAMWLKVAKLYTGVQVLKALDGRWVEAATGLLAQVDLCRRSIPSSRTIVFNLVSKAVMTQSLRALACLLDQQLCPRSVASQALAGLPQLSHEEYGARQAFAFEYLAMAGLIDRLESGQPPEGDSPLPAPVRALSPLLLSPNRTKQYFADYWTMMLEYEAKPPHTWPAATVQAHTPLSSRFLWWMQNAAGKVLADVAVPSMERAVHRSYALKARHDLVRISAELRLAHTQGQSVEFTLRGLDTFQALDPYSGRNYMYSQRDGLLYSVGPDRVDAGGAEKLRESGMNYDIAIAVSGIRTAS